MVEKHPPGTIWPNLAEPLRQFGLRLADWLAPASDARADVGAYRITLELPGVDEADIDVAVEQGLLTVRGEKRASRQDKGETWYFTERQYGSFQRSFRLPPDADDQAVSAGLADGVLTISVPRRAQAAGTGRKIPITRGPER